MKHGVLNLKFISLCGLTFLTLCSVTVFFDFHGYLLSLGFETKTAGFLISLYSLSAMSLYASVSQRITLANAYRAMVTGAVLLAGCAIAYRFASEFWMLAGVRMVHGAGVFLIMASCMVVLVSIIPAEQSGYAFSLYSVALLAPYSLMPAVSELVRPWLDSPTMLYLVTGCLLLPVVGVFSLLRPQGSAQRKSLEKTTSTTLGLKIRTRNLLRRPVLAILLMNGVYFTLFSALFYFFEGFARERGLSNPGFFFTLQMGVMVAIRLFGGRIFDRLSKVEVVAASFLITGTGFVLLFWLPIATWAMPIAVVFGIGMGLCIPPLNSLMYLVSKAEFRGYNANMMMLGVHLGTFTGASVGSLLIDIGGYNLFLMVATSLTVCVAVFFLLVNPAKEIVLEKSLELQKQGTDCCG
jgi:predicted MFS family arabinose efflux permease